CRCRSDRLCRLRDDLGRQRRPARTDAPLPIGSARCGLHPALKRSLRPSSIREGAMTILRMISAIVAAALAMVFQAGFADAAIKTQYVDYKDGGTSLKGYLAYDDSKTGKRP